MYKLPSKIEIDFHSKSMFFAFFFTLEAYCGKTNAPNELKFYMDKPEHFIFPRKQSQFQYLSYFRCYYFFQSLSDREKKKSKARNGLRHTYLQLKMPRKYFSDFPSFTHSQTHSGSNCRDSNIHRWILEQNGLERVCNGFILRFR